MATIPLSIARYIKDTPAKSPRRLTEAQATATRKSGLSSQQAKADARRISGTCKRFEELLADPLVKESGRSNADGLLTSQGEARFKSGEAISKDRRYEQLQDGPLYEELPEEGQNPEQPQAVAQRAVLESNSVSLMAALGAEISRKSFPQPVAASQATSAAEQAAAEIKAGPEPSAAKSKNYASDPSVRNAAKALQRRMLQLDPNAEKWANNVLTNRFTNSLNPSGKLSATFESGKEGIEAVGYDRTGGTSYGKYQIASRTGSMKAFLKYLDTQEPEWAQRLRLAGPANTGSRKGKMPSVWKTIAKEHPKRFEQLQDTFILQSHYEPALKNIMAQNKVDLDALDPAVKEVLLSTSVQHGPNGAAEIFAEAMQHAGANKSQNFDEKLIKEIYESRSSDFPSSSKAVQRAVRSRLMREESLALRLLDDNDIKNMF